MATQPTKPVQQPPKTLPVQQPAKQSAPVPAAPPSETQRSKFERLGKQRMSKALKSISIIGHLSGSAYDFTEADIKKMEKALLDEIVDTIARFKPKVAGEKIERKFDFGG